MSIDVLTIGVGFFSFCIFSLIQLITFRFIAPEALLRSLLVMAIVISGLPAVLMFLLKPMDLSLQAWISATVLAVLIQGLLCFAYVLCVFGPYETSVRMRLVREIAGAGPQGISFEELSGRYNDETIVKIRLRRLLGSGDIVEKDGLYKAVGRDNFFFLFDAIAGVIKRWIDG